ncbi:unnamed protein product [Echinostoma caproni]|uniref:NTR domain-containing protein n=1 Tax=Echinostoma caproni TaxID=27848 RepID=A0A183AR24_9TREM|nr:unnamed protein product [Echinostoma caproni]
MRSGASIEIRSCSVKLLFAELAAIGLRQTTVSSKGLGSGEQGWDLKTFESNQTAETKVLLNSSVSLGSNFGPFSICCESLTCKDLSMETPLRPNKERFRLESAQLELEAAEAIKRASNAKRRAAAALGTDSLVRAAEEVDDVPVGDQIRVKLPSAEEKITPPTPRYPWDCEPNTSYTRLRSDMAGYNTDKLLTRLELPRCELPCFDGQRHRRLGCGRKYFIGALIANTGDPAISRLKIMYVHWLKLEDRPSHITPSVGLMQR